MSLQFRRHGQSDAGKTSISGLIVRPDLAFKPIDGQTGLAGGLPEMCGLRVCRLARRTAAMSAPRWSVLAAAN